MFTTLGLIGNLVFNSVSGNVEVLWLQADFCPVHAPGHHSVLMPHDEGYSCLQIKDTYLDSHGIYQHTYPDGSPAGLWLDSNNEVIDSDAARE